MPKKPENNKKISKPKEMLEKIERDRRKREEKEKLKILEKLEAQVLKKKKLNHLSTNNSDISNWTSIKEPVPKRLIDSKIRKTFDGFAKQIDDKLLDDSEFRKTIRKEKIEIVCEREENSNPEIISYSKQNEKDASDIKNFFETNPVSEEEKEKKFLSNLSKEKKKFFLLKLADVYEFLSELKLVRYIETFIEDGIEDIECILGINYGLCILEIDSGYFEERNVFTEDQRERILNKIKELKKDTENFSYSKTKILSVFEFGTDPMIQDEFLPINKNKKCCWNCLKVILEENSIEHFFEEKIMKNKVVIYLIYNLSL